MHVLAPLNPILLNGPARIIGLVKLDNQLLRSSPEPFEPTSDILRLTNYITTQAKSCSVVTSINLQLSQPLFFWLVRISRLHTIGDSMVSLQQKGPCTTLSPWPRQTWVFNIILSVDKNIDPFSLQTGKITSNSNCHMGNWCWNIN